MPIKIRTAEQYREASEEAQRRQDAAAGSPEYARLKQLATAMQEYELAHLADPSCRPGRPPGSV